MVSVIFIPFDLQDWILLAVVIAFVACFAAYRRRHP
jgi:hypothetical protein